MESLVQKWKDASAFDKLMWSGGAAFAILILFILIAVMMPKKVPVQPIVRQVDPLPPDLLVRIDEVEAAVRQINADLSVVAEQIQNIEGGVKNGFAQVTGQLNDHRGMIEAIGQLHSVPKAIRVVREHKGESNKSD